MADSETAAAAAPTVTLATPGYDHRFPHTNQAKHCWANYNMWVRCRMDHGAEAETCQPFKKTYRSLCPDFWSKKWDEQVEKGTYPVSFERKAASH